MVSKHIGLKYCTKMVARKRIKVPYFWCHMYIYTYMALGLKGQPRHPMIAKHKQMLTGFSINVVQYTAS